MLLMKALVRRALGLACSVAVFLAQGAEKSTGVLEKGDFRLSYDERGITGLANPHDPFGAEMLPRGQRLGLTVKFKAEDGNWRDVVTSYAESSADESRVIYANSATDSSLKVTQTFKTDGAALDWDVALQATTNLPVEIGDLAINIPVVGPRGEEPKEIFEHHSSRRIAAALLCDSYRSEKTHGARSPFQNGVGPRRFCRRKEYRHRQIIEQNCV
jgi:hypothetical protein